MQEFDYKIQIRSSEKQFFVSPSLKESHKVLQKREVRILQPQALWPWSFSSFSHKIEDCCLQKQSKLSEWTLNTGSDLYLWKDHARQKCGMKRPCSTQAVLEKTLAGPNDSTGPNGSTRLWFDPNFWCWTLARPKMFTLDYLLQR